MPRLTSGTRVFGRPIPSFIADPFVSATDELDQFSRVIVTAERGDEIQTGNARAQLVAKLDGDRQSLCSFVGRFADPLADRIGDIDTRDFVVEKLGVSSRGDRKDTTEDRQLERPVLLFVERAERVQTIGVEDRLRYRVVGTGVDLALQHARLTLEVRCRDVERARDDEAR